jgi:hypothetical protein
MMPFLLPRTVYIARFLLAGLALYCHAVSAQEVTSEYTLRAAMVFNFLKFTAFTDFPSPSSGNRLDLAPSNNTTINLCISVRNTRQAQALAALAGRKIGGRELQVTPFSPSSGKCHVFYVDSRQQWNAAAEQSALTNALSISPVAGFAKDGGMIEITAQKNTIGFEINLAQSRRAGFRFSPQLLRLAGKIHE